MFKKIKEWFKPDCYKIDKDGNVILCISGKCLGTIKSEYFPGMSATFVDKTSFVVVGDQTIFFSRGRRVRANCGVDGYKVGIVKKALYSSPNTTVTICYTLGDLTSNLSDVKCSIKVSR